MLMGVVFFSQQNDSNRSHPIWLQCAAQCSAKEWFILIITFEVVFLLGFFLLIFSLHVFSKSDERIYLFIYFVCFVFGFAFYGVGCGTMSNLLEFGGFLDSVFCLGFFFLVFFKESFTKKGHHDFYVLCHQPP